MKRNLNVWSLKIYRAVERNGTTPVTIRTQFEKEPRHCDMLRYDHAFHNPADVSQIIFPVWKTKEGRTVDSITHGRWNSFSILLTPFAEQAEVPSNLDEWITYVHGPKYELVRKTFGEYRREHPKYELVGWR